jgi:2-amino-4-hydroxy-6-hydroxymethyldihydropteridine diphosphokinase
MYNYILSLGSNIEPKMEYLNIALNRLQEHGQIIEKSSLYLSEPWGETNQAAFYNAVIRFESRLDPMRLLRQIKLIEVQMGRIKSKHWGARIIDIDILFVNDLVINKTNLNIPHKYLTQRRFVLEPLAELTKELHLPFFSKTAGEILGECNDISTVKKLHLAW